MKYSAKYGENGMSKSYLLDTNIVSAILKKNEKINQKMEQVRRQCQSAFISGITYYEVKRGLLATRRRKLLEFDVSGVVRVRCPPGSAPNAPRGHRKLSGDIEEGLCRRYRVLPVLDEIEVLEIASEIHAELKGQGRRLEDADILIAATAITQGLILVSHERDRQRVTGSTIEDWLEHNQC